MSKVARINEDLYDILKEVAVKLGKRVYQVTYKDLFHEEIMQKLDKILELLYEIRDDIKTIKKAFEKVGAI